MNAICQFGELRLSPAGLRAAPAAGDGSRVLVCAPRKNPPGVGLVPLAGWLGGPGLVMWKQQSPFNPAMNPKKAFEVLANEVSMIRARVEGQQVLAGILAGQISRQRAELVALQSDVEEAAKTLEQSEPQKTP